MTAPPPEKPCTRCEETKPLEDFHACASAKDGKTRWCKLCFIRHRKSQNAAIEAQRLARKAEREAVIEGPEAGKGGESGRGREAGAVVVTYEQALARQQWDNGPCRVIKIEQLPDRYRLSRRDGIRVDVTLEFGRERKWLAICVRDTQ